MNKETKESVYDAHPNGWGEHPAPHVPGQVIFGPTSRACNESEENLLKKVTESGKHFVEQRSRLEKVVFIGSLAALGLIGGYTVLNKKRHKVDNK